MCELVFYTSVCWWAASCTLTDVSEIFSVSNGKGFLWKTSSQPLFYSTQWCLWWTSEGGKPRLDVHMLSANTSCEETKSRNKKTKASSCCCNTEGTCQNTGATSHTSLTSLTSLTNLTSVLTRATELVSRGVLQVSQETFYCLIPLVQSNRLCWLLTAF